VIEHTILLVEDSYDDRLLALRALKKNNIQSNVVAIADGAEALDFVRGIGAHVGRVVPDVVLLDLKLPKMDGLDVLRCLRSHHETQVVPVIIMSSSSEPMDRLHSYQLGANSYIRKPVDFARFLETMKMLATYWFSFNEGPPRGLELG